MKKFLIFALFLAFGLLGNSFQAHAASDYYSNLTISSISNFPIDANGILNAKVGDTIEFDYKLSMEVGIGTVHWRFPLQLSCEDGGGTIQKCKVVNKGDGSVNCLVTVMTDWVDGKSTYQDFTAKPINFHITDGSGTSKDSTVGPSSYKPLPHVGKPDLVIIVSKAKLVTRKIKGVATKQYKIGVTVKNVGTGDANSPIYYSAFSEMAAAPILVTKTGLGASKGKKVFFYLDATEKGNIYTLKADPDGTISEFDETNNEATIVVGK